jgi:hypothetical protein
MKSSQVSRAYHGALAERAFAGAITRFGVFA